MTRDRTKRNGPCLSSLLVAMLVLPSVTRAQSRDECDIRVVDQHGKPVAGAEVSSVGPATLGVGGSVYFTDARGVVRQVDGDYGQLCPPWYDGGSISVMAPWSMGGSCAGQRDVEVPLKVWEKQRMHTIALPLKHFRRASVHGQVVSTDGKPFSGVSVEVRSISPKQSPGCEGGGFDSDDDWPPTTDKDGRFALPLLPVGKITLELSASGYPERQSFDVSLPSPPVKLELRSGFVWTGKVFAPDGSLIKDCSVELGRADGLGGGADCTAQGFTAGPFVPGTYGVGVYVRGHPVLGYRKFESTVEIPADKPLQQDIRLPSGDDISGQAFLHDGRIAHETNVVASPVDARNSHDDVVVRADRNGRFVFKDLTPGTWYIGGIGVDRIERLRPGTAVKAKTGTANLHVVVSR